MNQTLRRARVVCAALAMSIIAQAPLQALADVAGWLATLSQVAPEGQANSAAQQAWKQLSQADAASLPAMLAALDTAGPLGANWIRGAVESVVSRTLADGGALPMDELQKFLANKQHAPRARRLAFECMAQADPDGAAKLVPGFLNDPSNELRRDAVALLLGQGKELLAADKKAEAEKVLDTALAAARDVDQVEELAEKLKGLGHEVDLPRHFGFLLDWKLIGPFDNTDMSGFDVVYPPETELKLDAKYPGKGMEVSWVDGETTDRLGEVDLNKLVGKHKGAIAYALAEFDAAQGGPAELRLGCVNANKLWLNGELLGGHNVYHAGAFVDQYVFRGTLKPGRNTILLKICQNEQTESWAQVWNFQLRVCDAAGTAILAKNRPPSTPPAAAGGQ